MIDLVILDVNGTLFPLDPVRDRFTRLGLDGHFDLWFTRILRDGIAASAAGDFAPFVDLARHHLVELLDEHGQPATQQVVDEVLDGFRHVTAHADVAPALQRLADAGVTVTTLTNGTVDITRAFLSRGGLDGWVTATYDVGAAGRWKPAPEPYEYVLEQHGVRPLDAALISIHPWDVQGAVSAGLSGAWVNRTGRRHPTGLASPTVEASTMTDVVDRLLDLP